MITAPLPAHNSREEAITLNKKWTLILLCASALALMTGCATNADVLPSPSPSMIPSPSPVITMPPATATPTPTADISGVMTVLEAKTVSDKTDAEIEKLSEVDTANSVVVEKMAIVGVTFDSQYKGGLTTRFTDMVADRIGVVKAGIGTVGVTNDPEIIKQIEDIKASLDDAGTTLEDVREKVGALIDRVAPTNTPAGT